jgi:hypothetical protein
VGDVPRNNPKVFEKKTIPKYHDTKVRPQEPLEQYNQTKDARDYLWYTTRYCSVLSCLFSLFFILTSRKSLDCILCSVICSFRLESDDLPFRRDVRPVLQIKSSSHSMIEFANDAFVGNLDRFCNNIVFFKSGGVSHT